MVEGFGTKWLRATTAESLGRTPETSLGSLRLVEECLIAVGFEEDDAKRVVVPFKEAHNLRSKVKGHASGKDGLALKKEVLKEHGSFKEHFRNLCQRCDVSIRAIAVSFKGKATP